MKLERRRDKLEAPGVRISSWSEGCRRSNGAWTNCLTLSTSDFREVVSSEGLQLHLEGNIQVNEGPLSHANSAAGEKVVQALFARYRDRSEDFLKDLAGGFRLALWDPSRQKLIVAVDPFATKPIYYAVVNGNFAFASKISCLTELPEFSRDIDPNVLYFFVNHSFVPAPFTVYRGIHRLEPGHYACWQRGQLTVNQYWDIRYEEDPAVTEDAVAEMVRSSVERSVESYLNAKSWGKEEVGAFLSGGTDSSTLVGLMNRSRGDRIRTFSVGFHEQPYNEIHFARIAASRFGAEPHECILNPQEALEALPVLTETFDEPFGNSSAIPTLFCLRMAREAGVKLMLAGDGGDELFAGNERYLGEKYFLPYDTLPAGLQAASHRLSAFLPGVHPFRKIRRYIERASEPNPERFFHYQLFFRERADEFFTEDFLDSVNRDFTVSVPRRHYRKVPEAAPLNRLLYMDLKMCIADNDLFKVNRMAEASGVEVCFPYLDRNLAEMTGKIPAGMKLKGLRKRYIFKKAFKDLLPREILQKRKHGFGLPSARWLRSHGGFRDMVHSLVLDRTSLQRGYFKRSALEELLRKHDEEKSDFYGTLIWNLMMLELWHQKFFDRS